MRWAHTRLPPPHQNCFREKVWGLCDLIQIAVQSWTKLQRASHQEHIDELRAALSANDQPKLQSAISKLSGVTLSHSLLCNVGEVPSGCEALRAEIDELLERGRDGMRDNARELVTQAAALRNAAKLQSALDEAASRGIDGLEKEQAVLKMLLAQQDALGTLKAVMKDPNRTCSSLLPALTAAEAFDELRDLAEFAAAKSAYDKLDKKETADKSLWTAAEAQDTQALKAAIAAAEPLGIRTKPFKKCLTALQALDAQNWKQLEQLVNQDTTEAFLPRTLREKMLEIVRRAADQGDAIKKLTKIVNSPLHDADALRVALSAARSVGVPASQLASAEVSLAAWEHGDQFGAKVKQAVACRDTAALEEAIEWAEKVGVDAKAGQKALRTLQREDDLQQLLNANPQDLQQIKKALADAVAAGADKALLNTAGKIIADLTQAEQQAAMMRLIQAAIQAGDEKCLGELLEKLPSNMEDDPEVDDAKASLVQLRKRRQVQQQLEQLLTEDDLDIIQLEHTYDRAVELDCPDELLRSAREEMDNRRAKAEIQMQLTDALRSRDPDRIVEAMAKAEEVGLPTADAAKRLEAAKMEKELMLALRDAQEGNDKRLRELMPRTLQKENFAENGCFVSGFVARCRALHGLEQEAAEQREGHVQQDQAEGARGELGILVSSCLEPSRRRPASTHRSCAPRARGAAPRRPPRRHACDGAAAAARSAARSPGRVSDAASSAVVAERQLPCTSAADWQAPGTARTRTSRRMNSSVHMHYALTDQPTGFCRTSCGFSFCLRSHSL